MQRNAPYWILFLAVSLGGLFWMTPPASANASLPQRSLAFAATLASTQAVTATQPLTVPVAVTKTTAVTITTTVTESQTVTKTTPVTTTSAVTTTPAPTGTANITTTPAVTSTPPVTTTPVVTTTPSFTPTAGVTQTPPAAAAPAPSSCQQLVVNGDFEARTGWRLPTTPYPGAYSTEKPFDGASSLRLGLLDKDRNVFSFSTGYELIRLPKDAKTITLKALVWRGSTATKDLDFQYLIVDPQHGRPHRVFLAATNAQKWEPVVYDLTKLKGQLVRLVFGTYNNGRAAKTVMFVDTVSIESCK
ncbi:MAG: hypothetical protein U0350_19280 [Caldilineaceae bacterium]